MHKDGVFEIAAVRWGADGKEAHFHTLMNPAIPLPRALAGQTGLTQTQIDAAPLPGEALQALAAFVNGAQLVCHGADALLRLVKKGQVLSVELPSQCVNTEMLTHYLFRTLKDTSLAPACAAAGLPTPECGAAGAFRPASLKTNGTNHGVASARFPRDYRARINL